MRPLSFASIPCLVLAAGLVSPAALLAQASDQEHAAQNVFGQMHWHELGPVATGGRIVDIAVHPQHAQIFWVAAASGGLWKTENGGISFTPQFQNEQVLSIGDIAVAPSNGDVLYVGTGEANNQRSSYWGDGVYKSVDGGKTFVHLGLDGTEHIGRIVVHPHNPDIAYVAALGALYRRSDTRGLYKTIDGGLSWQRVQDLGPDVGCVDVVLDPQDPEVVYAASYERRRRAWTFFEGGQGSRLWKSTDGGGKWQELAGGLPTGVLGRIGIEAFAGDGHVLYATVENLNPKGTATTVAPVSVESDAPATPRLASEPPEAPAEILADPLAKAQFLAAGEDEEAQEGERRPRQRTIGGEVYRSDDAGTSWHRTHAADVSVGGSPGYYYGQVRIDPQQRDTVYVLSVPVYKSTDGGKTWLPRRGERETFGEALHVDNHALWIDPHDGAHCLLGNDGGLAVTWDGGKHWDHLTHLPILQFYTVAADTRTPYRIYGGLQDNGCIGFPSQGRTSGGIQAEDSYRVEGGDGFYVCVDADDPDVVYAESQFGGMSRQNLRTGERKGIKPQAKKGEQALRFNWNTPILLSPHASRTVYTGSQHLHRSRDRGDTWTTISPDLSSNDPDKLQGNVPHCTITSLAESPQREGWLWVGTDDGKVWTSKDGGQRWQDLTANFPTAVQGLWVSHVEASPHAAETAFVSFTGYREDRREPYVFRTDDGGDTWLAIAHDLPFAPVNVVRQHPRAANVLLAGTECGAYVSIDDGAHWFRLGAELPRVPVHDLIVHARESHVLVGTHGRGIWALDAAALENLRPEQLERACQPLPPSDGVLLRRPTNPGNLGARTWSAANPFVQPTFRYLLAQDSEAKVKIAVLDATGTVLWSQDGPTEAGYHEVVWQSRTRGGLFNRGGGGSGSSGPRPGMFAVRLQCGEETSMQSFQVRDQRGPAGVVGAWPGLPAATGEEAFAEQATSEAEQEEAEEEPTEGEVQVGAGRGQ